MSLPGVTVLRRTVQVRALREGLFGGSRFWLAVFVLLRVGRWTRRVTKRGPMPVRYSQKLRPGEGLIVRHLPPGGSAS